MSVRSENASIMSDRAPPTTAISSPRARGGVQRERAWPEPSPLENIVALGAVGLDRAGGTDDASAALLDVEPGMGATTTAGGADMGDEDACAREAAEARRAASGAVSGGGSVATVTMSAS